MNERFTRRDLLFLAACGVIFTFCLLFGIRYFDQAFPEASIDFRYDRASSREIARSFLAKTLPTRAAAQLPKMKRSAEFSYDAEGKIFLERTVGLDQTRRLVADEVKLWFWTHRWFKPLQKEEIRVDVAPTGEIVAYEHMLPEEDPAPSGGEIAVAESFLRQVGVSPEALHLSSESFRNLPQRVERIYTWESKRTSPGGAPYRYIVTLRGTAVASYIRELKVPDQWLREYQGLRDKNEAAGAVDNLFMALTVIAMVVVFILRLRRGDIQVRFTVWSGIVGAVLIAGVSLNSFPTAMANYDTTSSYPAFIAWRIFVAVAEGIISGLFLMVIVGAGESLYRQRFRDQLAMPKLFRFAALRSKRVFLSFILGYTLFAVFLAYQVAFYIATSKRGAWSPAEIPYDDILNTAFPWIAVLFMGFYPAMSEEFMSRGFSIPFLERYLRSPIAAILIAGFIWGFGHATYPNQPFYIRGLEVGIAGVGIGILLYRFGLLPLLIWHYTIDALYTALLLFQSNNLYYVMSAGVASLLFAIPMIVSLVLYFRHGGFVPDDELTNASLPTVAEAPVETVAERPPVEFLPATRIRPQLLAGSALAIAAAIAFFVWSPPSRNDVVRYPIGRSEALQIATNHLRESGEIRIPSRHFVIPVAGFRRWEAGSPREEGGAAGAYDSVAADYVMRKADAPIARLAAIQRDGIEASTWMIRFFTPLDKNEIFVEVDPRKKRVIGYHRYQSEKLPGAKLDQTPAELIARGAFPRYGVGIEGFVLKEALSFQQTDRRDWLFHYDENQPLVAQAYRRVTIRVMGDRVTQFAKTVKIPESYYHEALKQTMLNIIVFIAKIGGVLLLSAILIFGAIVALRQHGFHWRRAARWTLLLAPVALLVTLANLETLLAPYSTASAWTTFLVVTAVRASLLFFMQVGFLFLALAILESAAPELFHVFSSSGRRRFGQQAALIAITVVAIFACTASLTGALTYLFPAVSGAGGLAVSSLLTSKVPIADILWDALRAAIIGSAALLALAFAAREADQRRAQLWWLVAAASFFSALDPDVEPSGLWLMLLRAAIPVAAMALAIYLMKSNPMAPGLTLFCAVLIAKATEVAHLRNPQMLWIAIAAGAVAVVALIWAGSSRGMKIEESMSTPV